MNISVELHRAAIGTFNINKRSSPTTNSKTSFLLLNALYEIAFAMSFLVIFSLILLKNCTFYVLRSSNTASPTLTYLFVNKCFGYNHKENIIAYLVIISMSEGFLKKKCKFNPKNIILETLCLCFSIKIAEFLFICGDVELNPGETFDFCLWNCNSLPAHNFERVTLIENYISIHKVKLFALTETALHTSNSNSDLEIQGFSILRNDLPGDHTHGGVMLYYRNDLAAKHRPDIQLHSNTLVLQINFGRKKVLVILAYRKFGQNSHEFNVFQEKVNEMIELVKNENPHCILVLGDLNAHLKDWYGTSNDEFGLTFQRIFNNNGLTQLIKQPTYITNNSKTCIDVLATDQPNLALVNEVHPSLHTNCHHQVIFSKFNIICLPPPPHTRHIWHYNRAKPDLMQKAATEYDWDTALFDLHPEQMVDHFDDVILNIAKNFIPNENKTFNAKEPPWLSKSSKQVYAKYKSTYKRYANNNFPSNQKIKVDELKDLYSKSVICDKERYLDSLGKQLVDPNTGQKKYWKILKKFLKKDACSVIPPLLSCEKFIVEAHDKCILFNDYFKKHCRTTPTSSSLPTFAKKTHLSLRTVNFTKDDILDHIRKLNPNKAHGHDMISVRILILFDFSIVHPLHFIYTNCVKHKYFPNKWKMANVIPVHKKNEKNLINNYRPISLLPICGKIFEKLIFNNLYTYIFSNGFITDKQSGYRKDDSTVKQLLAITHDINKAFDAGHEIRAVFLDISKAFDSVWHEGLLHKLRAIGIEGDMIDIIYSFLSGRKQRVTIDGKFSDWVDVQAGVPQGSLLGPILFLVFINDIVDVIESDIKFFADGTFIYRVIDQFSTETLNSDLQKITNWAWQWKLVFNPDLTKQAVEVIFSKKLSISSPPPLTFNNIPVKRVYETKHLGLILDNKLNFSSHLNDKISKAKTSLGVMKQIKKWVDMKTLENVYKLYVRPHLEYGDLVFDSHDMNKPMIFNLLNPKDDISKEIESIQYQAARIVSGAWNK